LLVNAPAPAHPAVIGQPRHPPDAAVGQVGPEAHDVFAGPTWPAHTDISFFDCFDLHDGQGGAGDSARATSSS
jgi:hypothetical protein